MSVQENTQILIEAAKKGDAAEVARLIPISNPKAYNSSALSAAAQNGHAECVKHLIPVSTLQGGWPLQVAVHNNHVQCVKLLIPVCDPKLHNSIALQAAIYYGHIECVDLLFDISDSEAALNELKSKYANSPHKWQYLADKVSAIQQRAILTHKVKEMKDNRSKVARKI